MNESWHIPRASLGGSSQSGSSNSSNKSHSNPSTVTRHSRQLLRQGSSGHTNFGYVDSEKTSRKVRDVDKEHQGEISNSNNSNYPKNHYRHHQYNHRHHPASSVIAGRQSRLNEMSVNDGTKGNSGNCVGNGGIKRGSRSSQGSTDSNSSTHSASSGSMLLTAANLERFAAIHKKMPSSTSHYATGPSGISAVTSTAIATGPAAQRQQYNTNLIVSTDPDGDQSESTITLQIGADRILGRTLAAGGTVSAPADGHDAIIAIDPNLHFVKTKDVDAVSIASSTHFTMVNGIGGPPRKTSSGICSRGHQITILILTMSMFFLIGILAAVYVLEMRAREMPH